MDRGNFGGQWHFSIAGALFLAFAAVSSAQTLQIPGGGGGKQVALASGTVSTAYSQTLPATGGSPPYSWSLTGGNLPKGLALSASGVVAGTPPQPGISQFTGKVTDTAGASAFSIFTVTIAPQPLTITTGSPLPEGIVGSEYPPQVISATGGNPPYSFQLTGALPGGLSFVAGEIGGIPAASGTFSFAVTATDSSQATATAQFQIPVETAQTDLLLSQSSLAFSFDSGTTVLPPGASVSVRSNVPTASLTYSATVTPAVTWLDVSSSGTTPGVIAVNLDPKAPALGTGLLKTSIVVTCIPLRGIVALPNTCAGNSQTINVSLNVVAASPQLAVTTSVLSFFAQTSNLQPVSQNLGLQNAGGGAITVNSVTAANSFVTVGGVPGTIAAGATIPVTVTVNPATVAVGFSESTIVVNTSAGTLDVPVTLFVSKTPAMTLNPAGMQFQQVAGSSPGDPTGSFLVSVSGSSTVNWTAALLPGANWLQLSTQSGTSTSATPGTVKFTVSPTVAATLAAQIYYGVIQVASTGVADSPLTFVVVLIVAPAASPGTPNPEPAGLLFVSTGGGLVAPQIVQVFTSSATPIAYQAATDSPWLLVAPAMGTTSTATPAATSVSVNTSGLAAGVYHGGVSYALSGADVLTVNATLIVTSTGLLVNGRPSANALPLATCTPAQLVQTQTDLVNNFSQPAAWPTSLAVLLTDNCGNRVTNGQVTATFSNGDPEMALSPTDTTSGNYNGTWTPGGAAGLVTIVSNASAPGFPAAALQLAGQVTPNAAPVLNQGGLLDAFAIAPEPGIPVAPGTIVAIYGSNLAAQPGQPSTIPLPTSFNQTSVRIGGVPAPLYYVSPGQINAQVPFELAAGEPYSVYVVANGAVSNSISIQLASAAPGIAQFADGQIIAQHFTNYTLVTEASPAKPGEIVIFYLLGLGVTNPAVVSGTASPSTNLAVPVGTPTLTLNGVSVPAANILFAGLTPTQVGLYQVDMTVPANAPNGDLVLVVTQPSGLTNSTVLPVHN